MSVFSDEIISKARELACLMREEIRDDHWSSLTIERDGDIVITHGDVDSLLTHVRTLPIKRV